MIFNDFYRQLLLAMIASIFFLFVLWTLVAPKQLAAALGYQKITSNGLSEIHAVYGGIFTAQFILCIFAILNIREVILGDVIAVFLLAPPIARLFGIVRDQWPTGFMRILFLLETVGGISLLLVRPYMPTPM